MLQMDQVHVIRYKVLREGASIRRVAHELGLSRNTISKYLGQPAPVRRTYRRRARPVWERVRERLAVEIDIQPAQGQRGNGVTPNFNPKINQAVRWYATRS
jgi:hypothetical protein